MAQTLYATFPDVSLAEKAAGALMDHGVRAEDISLVSKSTGGNVTNPDGNTVDTNVDRNTDTTNWNANTNDPNWNASNDPNWNAANNPNLNRANDPNWNANNDPNWNANANTTTGRTASDASWAGNRMAQAGDQTAADITGAVGAQNTAANFQNAADTRATKADWDANSAAQTSTMNQTAVDTDTMPTTHVNRATDTDYDTSNPPANTDDDTATDLSAKKGLSTTTGKDAGVGAAKGAAIGLGIGVLAALASLAIPGFGLVAGGGALAAAIGGAAGATVGGAVAGGVYGYLVDQGVSEQAAQVYNQAYEQGNTILAVHINPEDTDQATIESMLTKYGASNINTFAA